MRRFWHRLCWTLARQRGQDLAEYAILAMLIAVVAVVAVMGLGTSLDAFWQYVVDTLPF